METKIVKFRGKKLKLLRYQNMWVFPYISFYTCGMGIPVALFLTRYQNGKFEPWCDVTVNINTYARSAGCSFIDTKSNGVDILDWLETVELGQRTGNTVQSGFWDYPEFNFYSSETFYEYLALCKEIDTGEEFFELIHCPECGKKGADPKAAIVNIENGEESYEEFEIKVRGTMRTYFHYEYRAQNGELFSCVKPTLDECRYDRNEWLDSQINDEYE